MMNMANKKQSLSFLLLVVNFAPLVLCFSVSPSQNSQLSLGYRQGHSNNLPKKVTSTTQILAQKDDQSSSASDDSSTVEEYRNVATSILSNFMQKDDTTMDGEDGITNANDEAFNNIDFDAPKLSKVSDLETLAAMLDAELYEKEWFVTGLVNPSYFADEFKFEDPDVKVNGIEDYAKGVRKIFDQDTAKAEIISSKVTDTNQITITWRLSGNVNIGPAGLTIKPYICYTDFTVDDETGLIVFQEDRFDIPGWDILLSALFPFLIGKVTSPPAPPVEPRPTPIMPSMSSSTSESSSPLDKLMQLFK